MKNIISICIICLCVAACRKNAPPIDTLAKDIISPILVLDSLVNGQKVKAFAPLNMNGSVLDNIAIRQLHIHITDITHNKSVYHDRVYSDAKHIQFEKYFLTDTGIEYHIQIAAFDSVLNLSTIDLVVNTL